MLDKMLQSNFEVNNLEPQLPMQIQELYSTCTVQGIGCSL
jgi:hypothetical protein